MPCAPNRRISGAVRPARIPGRWRRPLRSLPASTLSLALLLGGVSCGNGAPEGPEFGAGPRIASLSPTPNAVGAAPEGGVAITFAEPVEVESDAVRGGGPVRIFGRWSGVVPGTHALVEGGTVLRVAPGRPLQPGERVTVTLVAGAVRGPAGEELRPGFSWTFHIAAGPADLTFELEERVPVRRPGEGRIQSYGAYGGDLDGDGDSDLVVPNERSDDVRVFRNDGRGGYTGPEVVPIPGGDTPSTNVGGDFDGDGLLDLAVGNIGNSGVSVFRGTGDGGLVHRVNLDAGREVRGVCVLDLEGNGSHDLVAASVEGDRITTFRNDGTGAFSVSGSADAGLGETSCAVADFDGDGLLDVAVGTRRDLRLAVLLSDGEGGLRRSWDGGALGRAWMLAAGDVNGDGHADVVLVNGQPSTLVVFHGDGRGGLERAQEHGIGGFPLAVDLGDLDGDGDLDIVTSQFEESDFAVFENQGDGRFRERVRLPASSAGSCAVLHDRDGDGDLDVTGIDEVDDVLLLYRN